MGALERALSDSAPHKIGEVFGLRTDLVGVSEPDNSGSAKYIKLTAGLTGAGSYNEGLLTSESVTGSAPLVVATAVIAIADSPMNGETVNLLNTEGRYPKPGTAAGTVANDQMMAHVHRLAFSGALTTTIAAEAGAGAGHVVARDANTGDNITGVGYYITRHGSYEDDTIDGNSRNPNAGDHTDVKHQEMTYYMRIK